VAESNFHFWSGFLAQGNYLDKMFTSSLKDPVELRLIEQLWMLGPYGFLKIFRVKDACGSKYTYKFDGYFFICFDICAYRMKGIKDGEVRYHGRYRQRLHNQVYGIVCTSLLL